MCSLVARHLGLPLARCLATLTASAARAALAADTAIIWMRLLRPRTLVGQMMMTAMGQLMMTAMKGTET